MADVTDQFYEGEAFTGYGTQLMVGQDDGSPETFVAIADVINIAPGTMETAVVEKTHLRSPEAHREKIATLRDSGPFVVELNWRPKHGSHKNAGGDGHTIGLVGLWRTRAERNWKIVLSDGSPETEWPFRGTVTRFQPGSISGDQKVNATAEITPLSDFSADLP